MSVITSDVARIHWAWLRNHGFDLSFILGIPAIAILTGVVVVWQPRLFVPILIFDLWFLGYHHVISTYTRLCFDRKSFAEHWPLMVFLLPLGRARHARRRLLSSACGRSSRCISTGSGSTTRARAGASPAPIAARTGTRSMKTAGSTRRSSTRCRCSAFFTAPIRTRHCSSAWNWGRSRSLRRSW